MKPVYKEISRALVKEGFKRAALKYAKLSWLNGFWGGPFVVIASFALALLMDTGVYKADFARLTWMNSKDKKKYISLLKEGDAPMTEEEKEKYQRTFLKRLSDVLSIGKYLK